MHGHHIYIQECTFIGEKPECQRKKANQNPYAVVISKRTAGCNENQGSWPQANQ